jgi:hypothetical protein
MGLVKGIGRLAVEQALVVEGAEADTRDQDTIGAEGELELGEVSFEFGCWEAIDVPKPFQGGQVINGGTAR